MAIQIILGSICSIFMVTTLVFMILFFRTKQILDTRVYELRAIRDDSLTVIDEIRDDLRSGRVLLRIDRIDGENLYLRR